MHADELEIDEPLVRGLLAEQFPEWSDLPLRRVEPQGTDNAIFRLGGELSVRLPRRHGPTDPGGKELEWLPRLAPVVPTEIPVPVAQGHPGQGYPWFWEIHTWVEGATVPVADLDAVQAARDLAELVRALQRIDPAGAPPGRGVPLHSATRSSVPGSPRSGAIRRSSTCGSERSRRRPGMARRSGTTATSTLATGLCATGV